MINVHIAEYMTNGRPRLTNFFKEKDSKLVVFHFVVTPESIKKSGIWNEYIQDWILSVKDECPATINMMVIPFATSNHGIRLTDISISNF